MCVCVCVLEILVLKIFWIERLFWEIFVLIRSLVELYVGLHSYLCFSHLKKLFWKAGSTPPRYLTIYRASQAFFLTQSRHLLDTWWINQESFCLLDSSSTPGGSIELLFLNLIRCCSIPSRYLNYRRPVPRHLSQQLPRYLPIPQLSSITEGFIYSSIAILLSFLRSLSICLWLFISQTLYFSLQTSSSRFLQAFSSFSTFGKHLIPLYSCISCLKPRFWDFLKILGFFKIDECLMKFWVGFSFKCV